MYHPTSNSALIQQSIEVAAEDIAAEEPGRWNWWTMYLIVALKEKGPELCFDGFLRQLQSSITQHLETGDALKA